VDLLSVFTDSTRRAHLESPADQRFALSAFPDTARRA